MIKGMTGYGGATISTKETKAIIEVKSLNGRYLDVNFYLPIGYGSLEDKMRTLAQQFIKRGRLTVSLKITQKKKDTISLNKEAVKKYLRHARSLKREFKIENDLTLSDVVKLPGVFEVQETSIPPDKLWPPLEKGLKRALKALDTMRRREGRSLKKDIDDKLKRMTKRVQTIQSRAKAVLKTGRKKMANEEYQAFVRSCDINEEISRLKHYIAELKILLKSKTSDGKKVDFIAQEMQRETNTIGAKLQDRIVSNAVIAIKSKIEKIREQAQNIE